MMRRPEPDARLLRARRRRTDRSSPARTRADWSTRWITRSAIITTPTCARSKASTRPGSCATAASLKPLIEWRTEKENAGRFSWTLGLYGTPAMAAEAGMSEQEYWQQIIDACFLDEEDPIAHWREVTAQIGEYVDAPQRTADRPPARRRARTSICGSRSASGASGWGAAAATSRASRSSRARTGAAPRAGSRSTSRSTATATSSGDTARVRRRACRQGDGRGERGADHGDDRDRQRGPGRGVLADRPPFLADHEVHGGDAVRRERRRPARQHAHRAREVLPGLLRRRSRDRSQRRSGSGSATTSRACTPTSSRRRTAASPPRCAAAASR